MSNEHHCAREGCHKPAYTGNAISINLSIGAIIVYVCAEHFAQFLQRSPVPHGELSREDVPLSVDPHDYPLVDERKPA